MVGIYLAYQPSLTPVAPEQIRRLTKNAAEAEPGLSVVEYTPVPHLYVRHIYRPITHASGASVPSPNGRVEILLHGEVYDSPALARYLGWEHPETLSIEDGPRLIAAGIERDGIDFVERLNGSFLLLAWFPQDKKLCIASDRCALRPHYYTWENGVFLMAPQVEALSRARQQAPPPNPMGVVELLTFEHLLGNKTLCEGIDVFPPASILEPGKSLREYWDFCFDESPATVNRDALREELQTRLATAVHRQLPASVPLGVPLSGGLDSRCLAGVAAHSIKNLPVFTFGNSRSLESKLAHQVALALKADEHTVSPDTVSNWLAHFGLFCQATDGMVSVRHGHAGMLLDTLSSNCGVVLDGLTGGILFGGHMRSETLNKPLPTPAKCWMARPAFGRDELRSQLASDVLRNAMENVEDGFQQRL
ncbi:TPA: hypothetical protein DDW35_11115, partial [Candidatus Sumerlaeota bacterium]|nr:hypothetical protein [Candidatus Sumerlaeota bacterium]